MIDKRAKKLARDMRRENGRSRKVGSNDRAGMEGRTYDRPNRMAAGAIATVAIHF